MSQKSGLNSYSTWKKVLFYTLWLVKEFSQKIAFIACTSWQVQNRKSSAEFMQKKKNGTYGKEETSLKDIFFAVSVGKNQSVFEFFY